MSNNVVVNDYLIITVKLAELNSWMIEAENVTVPVLNLITQLSVKAERTVRYASFKRFLSKIK